MENDNIIACICEGGAEQAIMDILLSHDRLQFRKYSGNPRQFNYRDESVKQSYVGDIVSEINYSNVWLLFVLCYDILYA